MDANGKPEGEEDEESFLIGVNEVEDEEDEEGNEVEEEGNEVEEEGNEEEDDEEGEERKPAEDDGDEERVERKGGISISDDPRIEFFYSYLSKSLRLKLDKWTKMLNTKEYKLIIMEFLDTPHIEVITFTLSGGATLAVYLGFPDTTRSKISYFIRCERQPITTKNMKNILIFGDLSSKPVEELAAWVEQICVPLLSNPNNQRDWPKVVAEDVKKHVHRMKNIVYEVRGKLYGQTLLPMPLGVEKIFEEQEYVAVNGPENVNIYLKSEIEGIIIKWSAQINQVLIEDSAVAFNGGKHPTPEAEFNFWIKRLKNFESIYDQLCEIRVRKMASLLEMTDSAYYPCFRNIFRNVVAGIMEARNINVHLKPLKKIIDGMRNLEYDEIQPHFAPMLHTLCLIWAHSQYYRSQSKIIILLKEICNQLIEEGCKFLDPGSLFQGDVDESVREVSKTIDILQSFRKTFNMFQAKVPSYFVAGSKPIPWNLDTDLVFERHSSFLDRLKLIETLFLTTQEYLKLEKMEIGGLKGRILSANLQEIHEQFLQSYHVFTTLTYDPLIPEDTLFVEDYEIFTKKIEDIDYKLASLFSQAFDDCHNIESLFKFISIAGTLLERDIIKNNLESKYEIILKLLNEELDTVKVLFDKQSREFMENAYMPVDIYFPPAAGVLSWVQKLTQRICIPMDMFRCLGKKIVTTPSAYEMVDKYNEMMNTMDTFRDHVFTNWATLAPRLCNENLKRKLIIQDKKSLLLQLNFDPKLQAVMREVRYLKLLGFHNLPDEAEELFSRKDSLTDWICKLHYVVTWYNELRSLTQPVEFDLICDEINVVNERLEYIEENLNWNSRDAIHYIEDIYHSLKNLHERVHEAQNNVRKIAELMNPWNDTPLFERKDGKKENLLQLEDHDERLDKRYQEVTEAGKEIFKLLRRNYHLYLDIQDLEEIVLEEEQKAKKPEITLNVLEAKSSLDYGDVNGDEDDDDYSDVYKGADTDSEETEMNVEMGVKEYKAKGVLEIEEPEGEGDWKGISVEVEGEDSDREDSDAVTEEKENGEGKEGSEGGEEESGEKGKGEEEIETQEMKDGSVFDLVTSRTSFSEKESSAFDPSTVEDRSLIAPMTSILEDEEVAHDEEEEDDDDNEEEEDWPPKRTALEINQLLEKKERYASRWTEYVAYIDSIVKAGLLNAISASLQFFMQEMDDSAPSNPLFIVSLELQEPNMIFVPSLLLEEENSFYNLVSSLLNDILGIGELIPRVHFELEIEVEEQDLEPSIKSYQSDQAVVNPRSEQSLDRESELEKDEESGEGSNEESEYGSEIHIIPSQIPEGNYREDIEDDIEIDEMKTETLCRVTIAVSDAIKYVTRYEKYAYLWLDDRVAHLEHFLKFGEAVSVDVHYVPADQDENEAGTKNSGPSLSQFKEQIDNYGVLYEEIEEMETSKVISSWFKINLFPFKQALLNTVCKWANMYKNHLVEEVVCRLSALSDFTEKADQELLQPVKEGDYQSLVRVIDILYHIREHQLETDEMFEPLKETMDMLKDYGVEFSEEVYVQLQELPEKWSTTKKIAAGVRQALQPLIVAEVGVIRKRINYFDVRQFQYRNIFKNLPLFKFKCQDVYELMDKANFDISSLEKEMVNLQEQASKFEVNVPDFKLLKMCRRELRMLKVLWDYIFIVQCNINEWRKTPWKKIDADSIEMECKKYGKELRGLDKDLRSWDAYISLEASLKNLLTSLRAVTELQNSAMRDRHWSQLMETTKVEFVMNDSTTLANLLVLNLHNFEEDVKNIVDKAVKETSMEKILRELETIWSAMEFEYETHERTGATILVPSEEMIETLEENQVQLQNLLSSKYISYFLQDVTYWQQTLSTADQVIQIWFEVQRTWTHLESIFVGSEDIRSQLPEDSKAFDSIDADFREILNIMVKVPNVVKATGLENLYENLDDIQQRLVKCEKALANYLETKRKAFPRFYFVSHVDLLDILSNGNRPALVARHLPKLYDSIAKLKFGSPEAVGMYAKDGEYVLLSEPCICSGKVEVWLNRLTDCMRKTMRHYFSECVVTYEDKPRENWIFDYPAQVSLVGTQIWWTTEVNTAFTSIEQGYENALKDYQRKQISQLSMLINILCGDLSSGLRQMVMTICTIDVHSRDVVAKMINMRVDSAQAFQWQSQLRHRWDEVQNDCFCNICDAEFRYAHEYLGCTPRLVITPLTDRCYITLTQSLHLVMGGAPAGPAGTGKTETTKDLGRAMGVMVYVFNCSEQMDYKSCGNMYKGLAQTGAWGCCDEFNRIAVEVLSVVSVQVKSVLDAVKAKKTHFNFMGEDIPLVRTVGMFITMNPGYAGRTELPENLKALFRPCAMVVPDFELICEIMLVAEGFQDARLLARKFITLYMLCKELLSKQDHYDWGLRAIKSVLVVAGALKRGDRTRPEDQVLMRALRDFNIPKIVTDDIPIFMGLIGDLFPSLDVPRKRDFDFEKLVKQSALDLKLQPEDNFILKIVQLEELLEVRHSVFIVGNAGTGKTMVWKTLFKTYQNQKIKPVYNDLNPKAVTNDELFGIINPATREWKDGLLSFLMRDQANMSGSGPKWILLDGDIDPMWIESLNTVMDDNKVLTLASNERIALTPAMRLLFEISHLRSATPATVSRAGILYINPQDLGWNPFVASWIDNRKQQSEKANLIVLFDKYVPSCLDILHVKLKKITPVVDISHVQMLCNLLDCLLTPTNVPNDCPKEWYEIYFVFACIWAFGSTMFQDQLVDYRAEFSKWWINEFKVVKFPPQSTVFSYYIDNETKQFVPWTTRVQEFDLDYDIPMAATMVDTTETTRLRFFMDLLMEKKHPLMLVGIAGSGKSILIADKLNNLPEEYAVTNVPFNFYTTSEMLQRVLEKPLEKKAGRNFGPRGNKIMVYAIDDMNMPEVDTYGTVQSHTIIRQYMDYGHWYDRTKLTLKDIHNCLFFASMNPTAGSFTINPRLQRHFAVFAVNLPTGEPLYRIYNSILEQHVCNPALKFPTSVRKTVSQVVSVALQLQQKMCAVFLPTAIKFHYVFNLRDLSNVFQGLLYALPECLINESVFIRLWMHETIRVYCDKLVDMNDIESFYRILNDIARKSFDQINENEVFHKPLIFCHFAEGIGENKYLPIKNWNHLNSLLEEAISQYNDLVAAMNLVLFEDAMSHVCRISRIVEGSRGNALLIGVGGSGKQSLSRLAAFISSLEVFQIQLRKGYNLNDMKVDLAALYFRAGLKNVGIMFLMSDAQVADEKFLVLVNDMLASGEVPDLFADDEVENIVNSVRNEAKSAGISDTRENCWKFYIDKVRSNMKVVLCFSPVGSTLRIRARKFPAVINCMSIDWFHPWPQEALESVSFQFLDEIDVLPTEIRKSVSLFMAYVHTSVNEMSAIYLKNERRYNYTTPKTFLEQISLYAKLLTEKTEDLENRIERLHNGLLKLASTEKQVDKLKEILVVQEIEVNNKNEAADQLIKVLSVEQAKVSQEKEIVDEEEAKVRVIEEDVSTKQKICEVDLAKAEPALVAAQEALNTLNKNNLTELKSFGSPPDAVVNCVGAVLVLFAQKGKLPKDRSWKACKIMMGKVDGFLDQLLQYDKDNIRSEIVRAVREYVVDPEFNPDKIRSKSFAAAGLCAWVINIIKYNEVYEMVKPKRMALRAANIELAAAREKLQFLVNKIKSLEEQLGVLTDEYNLAVERKEECQRLADKTAQTIDLANRLVLGLSSENVRWRESLANFKISRCRLPGDVLLVTAFISYVGCFTRTYRIDLVQKFWIPYLNNLQPKIDLTEDLDPLSLLTDDAQIAKWNNEGLPSDRMSSENATILTNSTRWPLMIDPQLQGLKWIKNKFGDILKVVTLGHRLCLDIIEMSITQGFTVLIENIGESVDAVLEPLLARNFVQKGRAIKIGDKEIDFNPKFRLILHTKLSNPHYKPEMQAQTTLINFTVTRDGLEEQLLADVVKAERPDLEALKSELTKQQNDFKIILKELEDDLLQRLASAGDDILSDVALVENLETTKKTAAEIEEKVEEAKLTGEKLDHAREQYRFAAVRGSLLYFILNELHKINPSYQFSLKAFSVVFKRAIATAEQTDDVSLRVTNLLDNITFSVFQYTSRGLFECDKLIFMAQMAIQILLYAKEIDPVELDFLLRFPVTPNTTSPVDFIPDSSWGALKVLSTLDEFRNLDKDIEGSAKRWRTFVDSQCPEKEKFPQEWKNKTALERLCMMRCLRPDRMTYAVRLFIEEKLGTKYVEARSPEFAQSYREMNRSTPVFFILSPGVDPLSDVEKLGRCIGFTQDRGNFHNVSLGQGQEPVAEEAMTISARKGHWIILQNIHLVKNWLPTLEQKMDWCHEVANKKFRLFMSAEPSADPASHIIPPGILESSIKITNEPPTGMMANLHKALDNFSQDVLEICTKETEFKAILFSLCYFHAVVAERRKFGPQGWNRSYPFNFGDLTISVSVLYNYLENNNKVPWEDLRYLFGEIMYGGHITDDWDRHLCRTYLEEYMKPELVDGDLLFAPDFPAPPNLDYIGYHTYVDDHLPPESPCLYGLHPNAEIGVLTTISVHMFQTILELQPQDAGTGSAAVVTKDEKVKQVFDDIVDKIPEDFRISDMMGRVEDRTPYILVAFQECERMNLLTSEMRTSLKALELGLKGELTITTDMEVLMEALFVDQVPETWTKWAYPSLLSLGPWFSDFLLRNRELENWTNEFILPNSVWLAGFFNPQSFLTAIMQSTARKNDWPLDRMCLHCDVTKKIKEEFTSAPREGANVHGLFMEGAQWDTKSGGIINAKLKDLYPAMPVIFIKAITQDKQDLRNMYECPVYKTRTRGPTYVWTFNLKSKEKAAKWTLGGVALLLQV